jgi:hypothetical protein
MRYHENAKHLSVTSADPAYLGCIRVKGSVNDTLHIFWSSREVIMERLRDGTIFRKAGYKVRYIML